MPSQKQSSLLNNMSANGINSTQEVVLPPSRRTEQEVKETHQIFKKKKEASRNTLQTLIKSATPMVNKVGECRILCIGDEQFQLEYNAHVDRWDAKPYQEASVSSVENEYGFKGNLKYSTVCRVGETEEFILAGG